MLSIALLKWREPKGRMADQQELQEGWDELEELYRQAVQLLEALVP